MTRLIRAPWTALYLLVPAVGILLLNARHYYPFISDDALISLRYAQRLLAGHGLSWTDGQPVEGYSNLLWVLLVAVPGLFGVDLVVAARLLGVGSTIAILGSLAYWYCTRYPFQLAWFPVLIGILFLSLAAPIAVWAIGGLEQPLFGALIAVAIPLLFALFEPDAAADRPSKNTVGWLSFVLGLVCLTRPDGPIFAAAAATTVLIVCRSLWLSVRVLVYPVLFFLAQLLFRVLYYGEIVPNTALVKIAPTKARWLFGYEYFVGGFSALAPFSFLAAGSLVLLMLSKRTRRQALGLAAMAVGWSGYLVFIGGDIFPAYRHFVPLMVIFAFALAEGARAAVERLSERPAHLYLVALATAALFVPYAHRQISDKHSVRAVRERWEWQGKEVALLLKGAFERQQPLMAVTAAGCLPYWSELPALDMLGLNDHYLPRHPPPDMGSGFLGHELGDAQYVLDRNPDIIVFTIGSPPEFRAGHLLAATAAFHERYTPVNVRVQGLEDPAIIYFNKYSDKLGMGIINSESTVTVPGFLFTGEQSVAFLNAAAKLVTSISSGQSVKLTFATNATLTGSSIDVRASNPLAVTGELAQDGRQVTIVLRASGPAEIEEVVLRKS
jgi:hypothetical protein